MSSTGDHGPAFRPLTDSARRARLCAATEDTLFEILGRWVPSIPEHEVKVAVASHSRHHAWHAELWRSQIVRAPASPAGRHGDREDPAERLGPFREALAEADPPEQTIEKLSGAYRVALPALVAVYEAQLREASEASDGPAMRWLPVLLEDERRHLREGEALLGSLTATSATAARADAAQARLEGMLDAAFGLERDGSGSKEGATPGAANEGVRNPTS